MLQDVLIRYERRRVEGDHSGPPLQAIRGYLMRWDVTRDAANRDDPTTRHLLAEVRIDSLEASR